MMTMKPYPVDPKNTKAPGGERHDAGRVTDPKKKKNTGSAPTNPSTAPTPASPCDDSGCATPKASDADASPASRADRPGAGVRTDRSGKTYEGKTGVSGEVAEDDDEV
jgi:hypothetical protein